MRQVSALNMNGVFDLLVRAIVLFTAIPVHESAHALVADKLGDHTARNMGRITLNPFAHLELFGSLMLLLTGFGWAKPVPVVTRNFKNIKRDMAITSLAGPISNILMAFVVMLILKVLVLVGGAQFLMSATAAAIIQILITMISINVGLAVFNLIPIPPLDGSRLLTALLPSQIYFKIMQYERFIMMGLFLLLFTGILSLPLSGISGAILTAMDVLTGFMGRIWR
ncbi:MAG: site-2 protease family protein [Angelakisella sp.]